jgi:hypothetical protein
MSRKKDLDPSPVDFDLFLNEETLIQLAKQHLKGSLPPRKQRPQHLDGQANPEGLTPITLLNREVQSRGWSARELALASGLTEGECAALIKGTARLRPETASVFARVFATSVEFWLGGAQR